MPKALADLEELGVLSEMQAAGRSFAGIAYVAGKKRAEARFPTVPGRHDQGLGVARETLDLALVERAESLPGVTLHQETRVNGFRTQDGRVVAVKTDHGELPCEVLVAADGRTSLLRRRAGLEGPAPARPRGALVGRLEVEGRFSEVVEVHLLDRGECYLTPVGAGQLQVALCLEDSAMQEIHGDSEGTLRRYMESSPALAELLSRSHLVGKIRGVGKLSVAATRPSSQGLFLAGDAAGFLDPVTGEGTSLALADTRVLAPLVRELVEGAPLAEVERAYQRGIAIHRRQVGALTHLVLALVRFPRVAHFMVARLQRRPRIFARLVAVAAGLSDFHEVQVGEVLSVLVP
jgi:2-polyprenyl-6-methoxyphenol hydroxylase-like FAD-dependent oxidoreductase